MQEKSLIKKKIIQVIDAKGINKAKFYQETGITRGILDQNNGISEENLSRFLVKYPEINVEWLISGKGEMFISSEEIEEKETFEKQKFTPNKKETDMRDEEIIEMQKGYIELLRKRVDFLESENRELKEKLRIAVPAVEILKNM